MAGADRNERNKQILVLPNEASTASQCVLTHGHLQYSHSVEFDWFIECAGVLCNNQDTHDITTTSLAFNYIQHQQQDKVAVIYGCLAKAPDPASRDLIVHTDTQNSRTQIRCVDARVASALRIAGAGQRVGLLVDKSGFVCDARVSRLPQPCACATCVHGSTCNVSGTVTSADITGAGFVLDHSLRVIVLSSELLTSGIAGLRIGACVRLVHARSLVFPRATCLPFERIDRSFKSSNSCAHGAVQVLALLPSSGIRITCYADATPMIRQPHELLETYSKLEYCPSEPLRLHWPPSSVLTITDSLRPAYLAWLAHSAAALQVAASSRWSVHFLKLCNTLPKLVAPSSDDPQLFLVTVAGMKQAALERLHSQQNFHPINQCKCENHSKRKRTSTSGTAEVERYSRWFSAAVSLEDLNAFLFVKLCIDKVHTGAVVHVKDCTGSLRVCLAPSSCAVPTGHGEWHLILGGRVIVAQDGIEASNTCFHLVADPTCDFEPRRTSVPEEGVSTLAAHPASNHLSAKRASVEGVVVGVAHHCIRLFDALTAEAVACIAQQRTRISCAVAPIGSSVLVKNCVPSVQTNVYEVDLQSSMHVYWVPRFRAGILQACNLPSLPKTTLAEQIGRREAAQCFCRMPVLHEVHVRRRSENAFYQGYGDSFGSKHRFSISLKCELDDGSARALCHCNGSIARLLFLGHENAALPSQLAQFLSAESAKGCAQKESCLTLTCQSFFGSNFSVSLHNGLDTALSDYVTLTAIRTARTALARMPIWLQIRDKTPESRSHVKQLVQVLRSCT